MAEKSKYCDDSMDFNEQAVKKSAQVSRNSDKVQTDYSIKSKDAKGKHAS